MHVSGGGPNSDHFVTACNTETATCMTNTMIPPSHREERILERFFDWVLGLD